MVLSRRQRVHQATLEEIKQTARLQMAELGTASISLRGIASQMGMSAPSLYNYYQNRDDLITALILDSYNSLAEAIEEVNRTTEGQVAELRLLQAMSTYRQWAVSHATEFMLITGNPIPGYHAPEEATEIAARRSLLALLQLVQQVYERFNLSALSAEAMSKPAPLLTSFMHWGDEHGLSIPAIRLGLSGFAFVLGLITLEIYGHVQSFVSDPAYYFEEEIRAWLVRMGVVFPTPSV